MVCLRSLPGRRSAAQDAGGLEVAGDGEPARRPPYWAACGDVDPVLTRRRRRDVDDRVQVVRRRVHAAQHLLIRRHDGQRAILQRLEEQPETLRLARSR